MRNRTEMNLCLSYNIYLCLFKYKSRNVEYLLHITKTRKYLVILNSIYRTFDIEL